MSEVERRRLSAICHAVLEAAPAPCLAVYGPKHLIGYVNPSFCLLIDKQKEELLGREFAHAISDERSRLALLDEVRKTGQPALQVGRMGGEVHRTLSNVAASPVRKSDGDQIGLLIQVTETTSFQRDSVAANQALLLGAIRQHQLTEAAELRNLRLQSEVSVSVRVQEALRHANEEANEARIFADSVVASIYKPLLVLTTELRIRLANRAFCEEFETIPDHLLARDLFELEQSEWNLTPVREALQELVGKPSEERTLEYMVRPREKERRWFRIHMRSIDSNGEVLILMTFENITAERDAERLLKAKQTELRLDVQARTEALNETEAALMQSRGELRDLAASLLHAQDVERRRISRELHDDLSQKVAKLQFDLETLEQHVPLATVEDAKKRLRGVGDQAASLANDLRRVAHGLHPSSLDHLGLAVALRSYAEEFARSTAVQIHFKSDHVPRELPTEIASCLYRIMQEALRNVGKHARGAQVNIDLSGASGRLMLSIRDDGPGFSVQLNRSSGGLGLISMQERVRLVQGQFHLRSQPGHGVHILIQVPIQLQEA